MNELEKLMQQHVENYKKAVLEIVNNNTNSLIDNDIIFLIKKPPLDSMDQIKTKFLVLAKKEKIILCSGQQKVSKNKVCAVESTNS